MTGQNFEEFQLQIDSSYTHRLFPMDLLHSPIAHQGSEPKAGGGEVVGQKNWERFTLG